jgi:XisH protein
LQKSGLELVFNYKLRDRTPTVPIRVISLFLGNTGRSKSATVKTALIKDGWTITDDPLTLAIGERDLYVDLGAEKLLIADRGSQKIAVEVNSFDG